MPFLEELPEGLARQRRLLEEVTAWGEADEDVSWLTIGCSLVRGDADEFSDLDTALGVRSGSSLDEVAGRLEEALGSFGELVACSTHRLENLTSPHRRVFAQYDDGVQLDMLVLEEATSRLYAVTPLYDPGGAVRSAPALPLAEGALAEYAFLGWEALSNVVKYLRRHSTWAAHARLEEARRQLWRLWAAAEEVPAPQYGLTSLLDVASATLPAGVEETVAPIEEGALARAALCLAQLLEQAEQRLEAAGHHPLSSFGRFVTNQLRGVVRESD